MIPRILAALFFVNGLVFAIEAPPAHSTFSIWSEFVNLGVVETQLDFLSANQIGLNLAVRADDISGSDLYEFLGKAERRGVAVRPWILLKEDDGYWANIWNAEKFKETVLKFLDQARVHHVAVNWISVDLESPPRQLRSSAQCAQEKSIVCLRRVFAENQNSARFLKARATFQSLISDLHARKVKVHAVTSPFILHDLGDRRMRFQYLFGTPVQDLDWDEVSFMTYRPEFQYLIGAVGPDLVYVYGQMARKYFGPKAGIDLGEIGSSTFPIAIKGFQRPQELHEDVRAVEAAGISHINIYSLDGLLKMKSPQRWVDWESARAPAISVKTRVYFTGMKFFRNLLTGVAVPQEK